ncbi:hypothetical protein [Pyxidicoccus caerfyrddinensis]|nr:hypothetical protein [Pyxidicoccus caerfyrddinensis]
MHSLVFDMRNGILRNLKLDFVQTLHNIQEVNDFRGEYGMGTAGWVYS